MTFFQFLKKQKREAPRRFFILLFAVSFAFWGGIIVLASPPDNPYAPGATLDPDCIPGSDNCTVYPPLATGLTATTTVTMSDYPLNFDSGTFYIDSLNNRIGIGTTSPATALDMANGVITLGNTANPLIQQYDNAAWGTLTKKLTIQGGATVASDVITFDAKGISEPVYQDYQDIILAESSLASYWKMDNDWTDSKGANDGTANGATFGTAKYGTAAGSFDGNSDATMGTNILNFTSAVSVEAWIKETGDNTNGAAIVDNSDGGWSNGGYALAFTEPDTIIFFVNYGWGGNEATATLVNDGEWHHVVGTYDGITIRIFVDGVEGTPYSYSSDITPCTTAFKLGDGGGGNFTGLIDEAAVYDTALSAETIINHYNSVASNSFRTKIHFVNTGTTYVDLYQDGDIYGGAGNTKLKLTPSVTNGATAVAYTFDTESALSTAGAKLLSVKNNGTEKFTIDYAGNIGIGLPAPDSRLHVRGGDFRVDNSSNNAALFVQQSTGNVGLGTSTPYAKLSVWGGGTGTGQAFEIANSASTTLASILDNGTAYFAGNFGIGTASPGAKLEVAGTSDTTQFIVRANSTQSNTNPLIQLLKSDGTLLSSFHSDNPNNIFLGLDAGRVNNVTGVADQGLLNIFIGRLSGFSNTTGYANLAIGNGALNSNSIGNSNIAIGINALASQTGSDCTAIGHQALSSNVGADNIAVGAIALNGNTTGNYNVGMGYNALSGNTVGNQNTGMGNDVLGHQTGGSWNAAFGASAGIGAVGALFNNNSIFGAIAGFNLTTGSNNILLGYQAGNALTTGSNNIIIGYDIDAPVDAGSNQLSIGNLIFGTGINGTNKTISSGNVGIGTSTPNNTIQVKDLINFDNAKFSTFLGYQAGNANTGNDNSFIGYQSGLNNTTGHENAAVGAQALYSNTIGVYNVAMGKNALYSNTTGSNNTAVGKDTLRFNTTGYYNVAMGTQSLIQNTTGFYNTAVGVDTLLLNTTGYSNTAMGHAALQVNTTGYGNTAVGVYILKENTTGYYNVAMGTEALYRNTSATSTTAIGYGAASGSASYSNQYGVYLGYQAGYSAQTGSDNNTMLGYQAGYGVTTGANNILLGYKAGEALTTGSNNIIIGYDVDAPVDAGSNQMTIGNLIFGTGINGTNKTISTGNVGIGTTTPWRKLSVAGTAGFSGLTNDATGYYLCLNTTTYEMATSTTACGASSLRFKENVQPMTYGLSEILQLNPVFYDWKDTYMPSENKRQIGLIAEEASLIIPELAGYDSDGSPINVDYPKATAVIIKAIQELNEKIGNSSQYVGSQITGTFDGILDWLGDKVVRAKEFVAEKITAHKAALDALEMKDSVTGEIYCVRISNGEWEKFKGTCGEAVSEATSNEQPVTSSASEPVVEEPTPEPAPAVEPPLESAEADPTGQAVVEETAAAQ